MPSFLWTLTSWSVTSSTLVFTLTWTPLLRRVRISGGTVGHAHAGEYLRQHLNDGYVDVADARVEATGERGGTGVGYYGLSRLAGDLAAAQYADAALGDDELALEKSCAVRTG